METLIPSIKFFISLYTAIGIIALVLLFCIIFSLIYHFCSKAEKRYEYEQYKKFKARLLTEIEQDLDKELDDVSLDLHKQKK